MNLRPMTILKYSSSRLIEYIMNLTLFFSINFSVYSFKRISMYLKEKLNFSMLDVLYGLMPPPSYYELSVKILFREFATNLPLVLYVDFSSGTVTSVFAQVLRAHPKMCYTFTISTRITYRISAELGKKTCSLRQRKRKERCNDILICGRDVCATINAMLKISSTTS